MELPLFNILKQINIKNCTDIPEHQLPILSGKFSVQFIMRSGDAYYTSRELYWRDAKCTPEAIKEFLVAAGITCDIVIKRKILIIYPEDCGLDRYDIYGIYIFVVQIADPCVIEHDHTLFDRRSCEFCFRGKNICLSEYL